MTELHKQIAALVLASRGVDISTLDAEYLKNMTMRRAALLTDGDLKSYLALLKEYPGETFELLSALNNNYTDFFRDPLTSAYLLQYALPALVERRCPTDNRTIRIWSAGCSTGQEAWSIAMIMDELLTARACGCTCRIFATDVNSEVLEVARKGCYERSALQMLRLKQLDAYFTVAGNEYCITTDLKSMVDFGVYDLLDKASSCPPSCIYGDLDVVFCGNVLLYYREDVRQFILEKLHHCLKPDGILVAGETERELLVGSRLFRSVAPHVSVFSPINLGRM